MRHFILWTSIVLVSVTTSGKSLAQSGADALIKVERLDNTLVQKSPYTPAPEPAPRVIVKFSTDSSAESQKSHQQEQQQSKRSPQQTLAAIQARFPSAQVVRQLNNVFAGAILMVDADESELSEIANVPGVEEVFFDMRIDTHVTLPTASETNADYWQFEPVAAEAGQGVRIAIIDSGIDPEHPMFAAAGPASDNAVEPSNDYCRLTDPAFCTDKIVGARHYTPTFAIADNESLSPLDTVGIGTFLAGTAAGNSYTGELEGEQVSISGAAPGAQLLIYKAFYRDQSGQPRSSRSMLVMAIEDAIADGADIVNISWGEGGTVNKYRSIFSEIIGERSGPGPAFIASAGNQGPATDTIECPACFSDIVVGALADTSEVASWSARGPIDSTWFFVAPGRNVASAGLSSEVTKFSGTGVASARVAGLFAAIRSAKPNENTFNELVLLADNQLTVENSDDLASSYDAGSGAVRNFPAKNERIPMRAGVNVICEFRCSAYFEQELPGAEEDWVIDSTFADLFSPTFEIDRWVDTDTGVVVRGRLYIDPSQVEELGVYHELIQFTNVDSNVVVGRNVTFVLGNEDPFLAVNSSPEAPLVGQPFELSVRIQTVEDPARFPDILDVSLADQLTYIEDSADSTITNGSIENSGFLSDQNRYRTTFFGFSSRGRGFLNQDDDFPYLNQSIVALGVGQSLCSNGCDEELYLLKFAEEQQFSVHGKSIQQLTVSPNGLVAIGNQASQIANSGDIRSFYEGEFARLAPLLADFEVGVASESEIRYAFVEDAGSQWFVIEYFKATLFGESASETYTFSVWIDTDTGQTYFNYLDLSTQPITGDISFRLDTPFDLTNGIVIRDVTDLPANGTAYRVDYSEATPTTLDLGLSIEVADFGPVAAFSASTSRNEPVNVDVTNSVSLPTLHTGSQAVFQNDYRYRYEAIPLRFEQQGELSAEIVEQPDDVGAFSVDGGTIVFEPATDFVGETSISYRVVDELGQPTAANTISYTVTNDAPTAAISAESTEAESGQTIVLNAASSTDPNGDELSYNWSQVSGPSAAVTGGSSAQLTVTAPEVDAATQLVFAVTVSDGYEEDSAEVSLTVEPKPSSGRLHWVFLLLCAAAVVRRIPAQRRG